MQYLQLLICLLERLNTLMSKKLKSQIKLLLWGFSNWKIANLITPGLSTINQPGELMGKKAFELFYTELQNIKKGSDRRKANC